MKYIHHTLQKNNKDCFTNFFILTVAEVCTTVHKHITANHINDALGKALKHMPKKRGGPLFQVSVHDFCIWNISLYTTPSKQHVH